MEGAHGLINIYSAMNGNMYIYIHTHYITLYYIIWLVVSNIFDVP